MRVYHGNLEGLVKLVILDVLSTDEDGKITNRNIT